MSEVYHAIRNCGSLTAEQKYYLLEHYSHKTLDEIMVDLNLTTKSQKQACNSFAHLHNLKKDADVNVRWDNISRINFDRFLGHQIEPTVQNLYRSKYGKYSINNHYFQTINNEWKAYWLGFLYADGCVRCGVRNGKNERSLNIRLCDNDSNHLVKFKESVQSDAPIVSYMAKYKDKEYPSVRYILNSKNIVDDLVKYGCTPNKSLNLCFPNSEMVSSDLIRHFIRGYFDGDGHIGYQINNYAVLTFNGTYEFLDEISKIFSTLSGVRYHQPKSTKSQAYELRYGSLKDIYSIFVYLYEDCNIYLDRKLNKFQELFG